MVLNVHRNHKVYWVRGEWGEGGMEVGEGERPNRLSKSILCSLFYPAVT